MATFTQVDDRGRIWQVRDLLPKEQAEEILATDWMTLAQGPSPVQESWPRRQVAWTDPASQRYSAYINQLLPEINQALGTEFVIGAGKFWIDFPGFQVPMHTDGHLLNAMQLYWTVPDVASGTCFYRYKNPDSLLYQFRSEPNTGYIMLNHPSADGSQPLLWHAMLNPVPPGQIRVSSYWQFE
jgi:hypothetical protein